MLAGKYSTSGSLLAGYLDFARYHVDLQSIYIIIYDQVLNRNCAGGCEKSGWTLQVPPMAQPTTSEEIMYVWVNSSSCTIAQWGVYLGGKHFHTWYLRYQCRLRLHWPCMHLYCICLPYYTNSSVENRRQLVSWANILLYKKKIYKQTSPREESTYIQRYRSMEQNHIEFKKMCHCGPHEPLEAR